MAITGLLEQTAQTSTSPAWGAVASSGLPTHVHAASSGVRGRASGAYSTGAQQRTDSRSSRSQTRGRQLRMPRLQIAVWRQVWSVVVIVPFARLSDTVQ
jgi:hypothetical protein